MNQRSVAMKVITIIFFSLLCFSLASQELLAAPIGHFAERILNYAALIVIEDEPLALKRTKEYVGNISYLDLLKSFDDGFEAIGFLREQSVDLIFFDIKMDELTGIQLLESIENKPYVIVTTAHSEYALKGYELNVGIN